jgi:prepilin-type N-terminal cleavage/methylation domain-containing protein
MARQRSQGFTLIEVLTVVVILGILLGIVAVFYNSVQTQSRDSKREGDMRVLQRALQAYYDKNGEYPFSCQYGGGTVCATQTTAYQSATGVAPISTLGPSTTAANLQSLLPPIDAAFGDPQRGSNNTINVLNTSATNYISKKSYFYLSMDLYNLSSSAALATNDSGSSTITCNFNSVATTKGGIARTGASHYYVIGYFSETQNKWLFYQGPFDSTLNNLQWNYNNKPECTATTL